MTYKPRPDISPPNKPETPQSATPSHPSQSPNTPVYGQSQANVQPQQATQTQPTKAKKRSGNTWRQFKGIFGTLQLLVGAIVLAFIINAFVFQSYEVVGDSMLPTLHNGDRLIISKVGKTWSKTFGDEYVPERGSIIVFHSTLSDQKQLVKRVIGLPGDKVIVSNGTITIINEQHPEGFNPDEEYQDSLTEDTSNSNDIVIDVPPDHIFVAGDNRFGGSSLDSRNQLGTVPLDNVVGTLTLRLLPLGDAKFF